MSSWWPLASRGAAGLIRCLGELWKWEMRTVHPLENGVKGDSGAQVSDQRGNEGLFIKRATLEVSFEDPAVQRRKDKKTAQSALDILGPHQSPAAHWAPRCLNGGVFRMRLIHIESQDFILISLCKYNSSFALSTARNLNLWLDLSSGFQDSEPCWPSLSSCNHRAFYTHGWRLVIIMELLDRREKKKKLSTNFPGWALKTTGLRELH